MVYYGLALNSGDLGGDIFMNFFLQSLMDIPALVVVVVLLDRVGRKPIQVCSMIFGGVACLSTIFTIIYGGIGKVQIERKAMIRNGNSCLTPSVQDTKRKDRRTKSNGTSFKTLQAESQKESFFLKSWPNGYPK